MINVPPDEVALHAPLPADDRHRHFGIGQTGVPLDLPAHALTLMLHLGDHFHVPQKPTVMSDAVTIAVN